MIIIIYYIDYIAYFGRGYYRPTPPPFLNCKIFVRGGGEDGDGMRGGRGGGLRLSSECSKGRGEGATKTEQV